MDLRSSAKHLISTAIWTELICAIPPQLSGSPKILAQKFFEKLTAQSLPPRESESPKLRQCHCGFISMAVRTFHNEPLTKWVGSKCSKVRANNLVQSPANMIAFLVFDIRICFGLRFRHSNFCIEFFLTTPRPNEHEF